MNPSELNGYFLVQKFSLVSIAQLTILCSLFLLSGCGFSHKPDRELIQQDAKKHFNNEFQGIFLADTAIKDNGYNENDNHYVAEMTITATAQISLEDYLLTLKNNDSYTPLQKARIALRVGLLKMTLPEFKAGDKITFKRRFLFIKTDNGWQLRKQLKNKAENESVL